MGKKLKPIGGNIQLIYRCPLCGGNIWVQQEEAQVLGFKVVCCGKPFELQTVHNLALHIKYAAKPVIQPAEGSITMQAVKVMRGLGYDRKDAIHFVLQANKKKYCKSAEELVKRALAEDKN